MKITFHGAAQEVTGSCIMIETDSVRFLVDCGMFQGSRDADARNREPFSFDPRDVDFLLLTHAHIDHSGLLPKLCRDGFRGPIYTSSATASLLEIMLRDSAHIQEYEAERARRHPRANHPVAEPIYIMADAEAALTHLRPQPYDGIFKPHKTVQVRLRDAGHILGSAILEVWLRDGAETRKLVFSGDLGQPGRPILRDPRRIGDADILFVESTYGDRLHKNLDNTLDELVAAVNDTLHHKGGNVIIPAFAVGRTQEILYYFHHLSRQGRLRNLNIFVDSPMATAVTEVTRQHLALFDEEATKLAAWHAQGHDLPNLKFIGSVNESRALNAFRAGAIIIAASGMCTAGRIKHHLLHNLGNPQHTVLITGYQARGTLGRRLVDGVDMVRIFGQEVPVRAEIHTLGGFSAHGDQAALMDWLGAFRRPPEQTYVIHGEPLSSATLVNEIQQKMGWKVAAPEAGQEIVVAPQDLEGAAG